jgi:hypothetical protein
MKTPDFRNGKVAFSGAMKAVMMALVIGVMLSCGGGGNKQQQSATTVTETGQAAQTVTAEHLSDFTDAQKKLVASFGKTEKGKRIVAFEKQSFGVQYEVSVYSGGDLTVKEYVIYFPSREEGFKAVRHSENDEVDAATLSVCATKTYSGTRATPFAEMYQEYREDNNYTVVE